MKAINLPRGLGKLKKRLTDAIVQDCPAELYACEVCGATECSSERWENCAFRLKIRDEVLALDEESTSESKAPSLAPQT